MNALPPPAVDYPLIPVKIECVSYAARQADIPYTNLIALLNLEGGGVLEENKPEADREFKISTRWLAKVNGQSQSDNDGSMQVFAEKGYNVSGLLKNGCNNVLARALVYKKEIEASGLIITANPKRPNLLPVDKKCIQLAAFKESMPADALMDLINVEGGQMVGSGDNERIEINTNWTTHLDVMTKLNQHGFSTADVLKDGCLNITARAWFYQEELLDQAWDERRIQEANAPAVNYDEINLLAAQQNNAIINAAILTSTAKTEALPLNPSAHKYAEMINSAALKYHIDPRLVSAVAHTESRYNANAVSPVGAAGVMQLMPATARRYGVLDRFDPEQSINGGAKYLRDLTAIFNGNLALVIAAYNAGEGAVIKYGRAIPPYRETQDYVKKVFNRLSATLNLSENTFQR